LRAEMSASSVCNFCEDSDARRAVWFCKECASQLCDPCSAQLHSRGKWKNHQLMPAEEATSVKRLRLCTEHKGERITHVCTTCNEMCCAHCFVDGKHAGHPWALLEGACSEVQKRVEKKTNSVNQMMQTTDRNLRTIAEWHDELNRSSDQVREKVESGVTRLISLVDEREQSMHAGIQEMTKSKARVLAEMTDEVNQSKMQLQSGTDAALKAIEEQEKYDFIINSPELENWLSTLVDMDITVKVAAVGASLNTAVHWDNVHRTLDGLQLGLRPALADSVPSSPAHSAASSQSRASLPPIPTTAEGTAGTSTPVSSRYSGRGPSAASPASAVPNAVYVNGLPNNTTEADLREVFGQCGEIKMINARHIPSGGFSFIFFRDEGAAQRALDNPRIEVNGKVCNVLAKKQVMA